MLLAWLVALPASAEIRVMALFNNQATVMIDGQTRTLRVGQRSPEGAMLVSASSDRAVIDYRGRRDSYALSNTTRFSAGLGQPSETSVSLWPTNHGMYMANGSIGAQTVQFMVDTGATYIALNAHDARRLNVDYRQGQQVQLSTASKVEIGYLVRLPQVKVGSILVRDVEAVVLDSGFPTTPLLGMSFLNRVDMQRSGQELRLRQRW